MMRPAARFRLSAQVQDVLLAGFVILMQVLGTMQASENSEVVARSLTDYGHLGYTLLAASGLALVVRRRWPVAVFILTAAVSMLYFSAGFPDGPAWIGLFVALYTLTAYGDGRTSLWIAALGIVALSSVWLVAAADIEPRAAVGWVFFRIGASVMSAALGESARSRRVIAAEAQERAEHAERTREEEARRRVDAERLRIAQEVHDTVAHAIAIINVQAGVTAHVLDKRPERARETLVTIEHTSAQALHEMRAILGVLRDTEDGREPAPGLGQLDDLVALAREAGLDVKLRFDEPPEPLPSAVDRAAYRILQESIINVIRHAGRARITITVVRDGNALEIRVTDDGPGPTETPSSTSEWPGRGIAGMRERCTILGGELSAGARPEGGFEVRARLPVTPLSPTESVSR